MKFEFVSLPSSPLIAVLFVVSLAFWLWSVVTVARTKTEDPFDRIVWLLIVLFLNVVGSVLYVLFGPKQQSLESASHADYEADIKRRANEGTL